MNVLSRIFPQYSINQFPSIDAGEEKSPNPRAYEIAGLGDYNLITDSLRREGLFDAEKDRVINKYASVLSRFPELNESDIEMLTVIDLFDPITAYHSVAVLELVHNKTEKPLASAVSLPEVFAFEHVPLHEFKRAALLHDTGKTCLPRFLIQHPADNDTLSTFLIDCIVKGRDEEVAARLGIDLLSPIASDEQLLSSYLREKNIHAARYVPVSAYLSNEELNKIKYHGFDASATLLDILSLHEQKSEEILKDKGFHLAGELAGQHHNYRKTSKQHPITIGTLQISVDVADLLHLVDLTQALLSTRSYKDGYTLPRVLEMICHDAKAGKIPIPAAYLWVHDELALIPLNEEKIYSEGDRASLAFVRSFIEEAEQMIKKEAPQWYPITI